MAKDISCFASRDPFRCCSSCLLEAMLDVGQSLRINMYKHIEFKNVVYFLIPFNSSFDPGLCCDRAYTGINTSVRFALHFFL